MEGANGKQWVPVVFDLLSRLIITSGFAVLLLTSTTTPGQLLILFGFAVALPVDHYRACASSSGTTSPSATTRRLDLVATLMQAFGCALIFIAQIWFILSYAKSFAWLGLTGSITVFFGGLLHALNVFFKMLELKKEVF